MEPLSSTAVRRICLVLAFLFGLSVYTLAAAEKREEEYRHRVQTMARINYMRSNLPAWHEALKTRVGEDKANEVVADVIDKLNKTEAIVRDSSYKGL